MNAGVRRAIATTLLFLGYWLIGASYGRADPPPPQASPGATPIPFLIVDVSCADPTMKPHKCEESHPGLNDWLAVILDHDTSTLDLKKLTLVLNGSVIPALPEPLREDANNLKNNALLFKLVRNSDNLNAWKAILGSPGGLKRKVVVTLQAQPDNTSGPPTVISGDQVKSSFDFVLMSGVSLLAGIIALLAVVGSILFTARTTTLLKDSLLPQLPPRQQTFSLGRCQMAFWFALVMASFLFLLLLLDDYNTVTQQALILMGLSGATAIFAVQIDASKDTPIGAANETLRAMGIKSYTDVQTLEKEIADRKLRLNATPPPTDADKVRLQTELIDRQNKLQTWLEKTAPFVSQDFYSDLTTDINGPALHRLQVFYWTIILGAVFMIAVYRDLAMPSFSDTLLALMGVTSAGYLGFKYPEQQG